MCGPSPCLHREKRKIRGSLPIVRPCARSGAYGKSVSQPCLPIWMYFLSCPIGRSHSTSSGFFSRGIDLCVAVYLVCLWEEGKSGAPDPVIW